MEPFELVSAMGLPSYFGDSIVTNKEMQKCVEHEMIKDQFHLKTKTMGCPQCYLL